MAKRGRKPKEGPRHPGGQLCQKKANLEGIELRAKVFGLSIADARDQKAGSFVGRLRIAGQNKRAEGISEAQYDAALRYLELRNLALKRIGSEAAIYERGDMTGAASDEADQARRAEAIKARWEAALAAVQAKQNECRGSNLAAALDYCVVRDESHVHMIGDLRLALNALADHFTGNRKAQKRAA